MGRASSARISQAGHIPRGAAAVMNPDEARLDDRAPSVVFAGDHRPTAYIFEKSSPEREGQAALSKTNNGLERLQLT